MFTDDFCDKLTAIGCKEARKQFKRATPAFDFDDIIQTARIEVWKIVQRLKNGNASIPSSVAALVKKSIRWTVYKEAMKANERSCECYSDPDSYVDPYDARDDLLQDVLNALGTLRERDKDMILMDVFESHMTKAELQRKYNLSDSFMKDWSNNIYSARMRAYKSEAFQQLKMKLGM